MPFDSRFFLVTALNPCLAVSAAGTVFAKSALKFRPLAVGFNGQIRKATPFSLDSAFCAGPHWMFAKLSGDCECNELKKRGVKKRPAKFINEVRIEADEGNDIDAEQFEFDANEMYVCTGADFDSVPADMLLVLEAAAAAQAARGPSRVPRRSAAA